MKLKDQVCSLELAIKLKELGFKQDSLFWWIDDYKGDRKNCELIYNENKKKKSEVIDFVCSAFTVAELGVILPYDCLYCKRYTTITVDPDSDKLEYYECFGGLTKERFSAKTMVDCMAKMLIYLKENNLI